jgi:nitric oxide reductase activation protein
MGVLLRQAHRDQYGDARANRADGVLDAGDREEGEALSDAEINAVAQAMQEADGDLSRVLEDARQALEMVQLQAQTHTEEAGDDSALGSRSVAGGSQLAQQPSMVHLLEDNRSELEGVQARLVAVLRREFQEKKRRPRRPQSEGGKVLAHRFWRLAALGDTAVFAGRKEVAGMDAATSILIDTSLSMDSRLKVAIDAAMAFSLALQRLNQRTRVASFPGFSSYTNEVQRFGESVRSAMPRSRELTANGGTPLGPAMAMELVLLQQQRQLKKTLVIVTDGQPDDLESVSQALVYARKAQIAVLGVGIGLDITGCIPDAVEIASVTELPYALEELFRSRMLTKLAA